MNVNWVCEQMQKWAPTETAVPSDNVGLIVGDGARDVIKVLVALDLSMETIMEAIRGEYNIIVAHHPVISRHSSVGNSITAETLLGRKLLALIENRIAVYAAHTNLDMAKGGVNDVLFDKLELKNKEPLLEINDLSMGLIGEIRFINLKDLANFVKEKLGVKCARFVGSPDRIIKRVAFCSGNGTARDCFEAAIAKKADVYLTGDIGYHLALEAVDREFALIDYTHFASENIIIETIASYLRESAKKEDFKLEVTEFTGKGQPFYNA